VLQVCLDTMHGTANQDSGFFSFGPGVPLTTRKHARTLPTNGDSRM